MRECMHIMYLMCCILYSLRAVVTCRRFVYAVSNTHTHTVQRQNVGFFCIMYWKKNTIKKASLFSSLRSNLVFSFSLSSTLLATEREFEFSKYIYGGGRWARVAQLCRLRARLRVQCSRAVSSSMWKWIFIWTVSLCCCDDGAQHSIDDDGRKKMCSSIWICKIVSGRVIYFSWCAQLYIETLSSVTASAINEKKEQFKDCFKIYVPILRKKNVIQLNSH